MLSMFQETFNTDYVLKQQLLETADDDYAHALNNNNIRYTNIRAMGMITDLYNFFGF